jgi:hypothetical protein
MKTITALMIVALLTACSEQPRAAAPAQASPVAAAPATGMTPEQLGALGAEIRKDPSTADELLQKHGLTRQTFEKAIRDVTENAEESRRYAEAYRKASA